MILAILGISILALIIGLISDEETLYCSGGVIIILSIIAALCLVDEVQNLNVIDDKIAMYEEQNTKIEEQIAEVVQQYMEYESGVFTEVSSDSAITLVSLYPELKSDALVASQIELYVENNQKITSLMEKKINGSVIRWWLYFGG